MRGSLGLVIGLVVGAGGMYLALRPPWGHGGATSTAPADGGVVAQAGSDAGVTKPKKKRRRASGGGGTVAPSNPGFADQEEYEETDPTVQLTAADRALEWRGDDVTLGPSKVDMAGGNAEARPLDDGEINNTISSQAGGVRDCVIKGATNTDLHATITVKMVVDGNGRVTKSRVQAPHYMQEHGILSCVRGALGRMKFPATGAPTSVSLPITLG